MEELACGMFLTIFLPMEVFLCVSFFSKAMSCLVYVSNYTAISIVYLFQNRYIYGKRKLKFYIRLDFKLSDSTQLFAFKHLSLQDLLVILDIKKKITISTAEILNHTKFVPQNHIIVLKILANSHKHLLDELTIQTYNL